MQMSGTNVYTFSKRRFFFSRRLKSGFYTYGVLGIFQRAVVLFPLVALLVVKEAQIYGDPGRTSRRSAPPAVHEEMDVPHVK